MTPEKAFETMGIMDELYQYKASEGRWYRWERGIFGEKEKSKVSRVPSEVEDEHDFADADHDGWYLYTGFRVKKLEREQPHSNAAEAFVAAVEGAVEDEVERRARRRQHIREQAQAELIVEGFGALAKGIGKLFK